jgi:hypothetical protein
MPFQHKGTLVEIESYLPENKLAQPINVIINIDNLAYKLSRLKKSNVKEILLLIIS